MLRDAAPASSGRERARAGGLYLHVPFCARTCDYCHFPRTARHDIELRRRTVRAIRRELALRRERCPTLAGGRWRLATAYIGGGTPSLLEPDLFTELVAGTVGALPADPELELTAEANPESLTEACAAAWRACGIVRVSIGVQSLSDDVLRRLGRSCAAETARRGLERACRIFPRVAADWILAPGVSSERLCAELAEAVALGVEHISLYILEVADGTPLAQRIAAGRLRLPRDRFWEALYLAAVARLEALGLPQYEVANFARSGCESRHNRAYWRRRPYLGLGPGAHGFWGRRRYANAAAVADYLRRVERDELPEAEIDRLDAAARRLERLILPLRTRSGVPLDRIPRGALDLDRGERTGLWRCVEGRLRLTPRGYLRLDGIESALARSLG
jgi:oxygen-independent coproporphyrinogen-3 oxidase